MKQAMWLMMPLLLLIVGVSDANAAEQLDLEWRVRDLEWKTRDIERSVSEHDRGFRDLDYKMRDIDRALQEFERNSQHFDRMLNEHEHRLNAIEGHIFQPLPPPVVLPPVEDPDDDGEESEEGDDPDSAKRITRSDVALLAGVELGKLAVKDCGIARKLHKALTKELKASAAFLAAYRVAAQSCF